MKTIYFECNMGAAGDMLMAALLELHPDPKGFIERLNALKIPEVEISAEKSLKNGVTGTHVSVSINGSMEGNDYDAHKAEAGSGHNGDAQRHTGVHEIEHIVRHIDIPEEVKGDVLTVYGLISEAESHIHGVQADQIHFHEVGQMDAIADIVGVCLLINELAPEQILASPVCVGSGEVRCAHGVFPVPAPATAQILMGVPTYGGEIDGELCTPTGAALLKHFVTDFVPMPLIKVYGIGYGFGSKDYEALNCVRAMLGETAAVCNKK